MTYETYLYPLLLTPILLIIELLYFSLARWYTIVDIPNHRSSHTAVTIRGGGIIFPIAILFYYLISGNYSHNIIGFGMGLLLISLISFIDDLRPTSNRLRLATHVLAVVLLLDDVNAFSYPLWITVLVSIFIIGTINAYNFMDGINGITGLYSLVFMLSALWINTSHHFIDAAFLITLIVAILVFLFFNFRTKAICFAGDVGSVSIAFIMCYLLILLSIASHNLIYLGLLLVYGLDAITTIIFRLIRRENIFKAHRSHFYQFLVNEKKISALKVSTGYAIVQLFINCVLIINYNAASEHHLSTLLIISTPIFLVFIGLRVAIEGRERLFSAAKNIPK